MYNVTQTYYNRVNRGEIPIVYVVIATDRGNHIYANKQLSGVFNTTDLSADGTGIANSLVDGSGKLNAVEISDRLLSSGILSRTLQPKTRDLVNSLTSKEKQNIIIELNNRDYELSKKLPKDPYLTKILLIYSGFENDTLADQILLFTGRITELDINYDKLILYAEEL